MYAVQNDTKRHGIKVNIVLYIKIIFVGQGGGYTKGPQPRNAPLDKIQHTQNRHSWFVAIYGLQICDRTTTTTTTQSGFVGSLLDATPRRTARRYDVTSSTRQNRQQTLFYASPDTPRSCLNRRRLRRGDRQLCPGFLK